MILAFVVPDRATKRPATVPRAGEVFRPYPGRSLVPVPPTCPTPQPLEDHIIHVRKRPFARRVPVINRPATDLRVELLDQLPGREVSTLVLDYFADLVQERTHVLA